MLKDKSADIVSINKPALILIMGVTILIGVTPASLALGRPQLLLYFTAGLLLFTTIYVFRLSRTAKAAPGPLAFLLAGVAAVSRISTIGVLTLLFYSLVYGIVWLVASLVTLLGARWQPALDPIAFYSAISVGGLMGLSLVVVAIDTAVEQLYPAKAGTTHAFYALVTEQKSFLIKGLVIALVILAVIFSYPIIKGEPSTIFYVVLQLYALCVGIPLSKKGWRPVKARRAVQAVRKLLQTAGYQVTGSPRTGDSDIDPLLVGLDLFAHSKERALAIQIKQAGVKSEPVTWTAASDVRTAARALSGASENLEIAAQEVEPILVLVDVERDETLRDFSEEESVTLIELGENSVNKILRSEQDSELQKLASGYFGKIARKQASRTSTSGNKEGKD